MQCHPRECRPNQLEYHRCCNHQREYQLRMLGETIRREQRHANSHTCLWQKRHPHPALHFLAGTTELSPNTVSTCNDAPASMKKIAINGHSMLSISWNGYS